jgi:molecular chaperone GrpE
MSHTEFTGSDPDHELSQDHSDELLSLRARVAALEETLLRDRAEAENQRKRAFRDVEAARKYAAERLLSDLLPVLDSLEKGLEFSADQQVSVERLREGAQMTLQLLSKATDSHGLKAIDPRGDVFNPEWHQAMAVQPSSDVADGNVLHVMQKGYVLADRLVRPALVIVAKAPEDS